MRKLLAAAPRNGGTDGVVRVAASGELYFCANGGRLEFCPWCGTPLATEPAAPPLGFDTLEFESTSIMGDLQQASMLFDNGYEVRVTADMASAGWELAIFRNGELCGTLPALNDKEIYRAVSEEDVSELMQRVSQLPSASSLC